MMYIFKISEWGRTLNYNIYSRSHKKKKKKMVTFYYSLKGKRISMAKLPEIKSKDKLQTGKHICNSYHKERSSKKKTTQ